MYSYLIETVLNHPVRNGWGNFNVILEKPIEDYLNDERTFIRANDGLIIMKNNIVCIWDKAGFGSR